MQLPSKKIVQFRKRVWDFYKRNKRNLPWRKTENPYRILLSEIMLQQTQVSRVERKYPEFLNQFPNFKTLAKAPRRDVIKAWQGMGYNRRAIALHEIAKKVMREYRGDLPRDPELLIEFPGIGRATAASILAFAWNMPTVFVETNIRRVMIHHFFKRAQKVSEDDILEIVRRTLPPKRAREWYWALMDYGTRLATQVPNPNKKSARYRVQPTFKGSNREMRGRILQILSKNEAVHEDKLTKILNNDSRIEYSLQTLIKEGFLKKERRQYKLT